VLGQILDRDQHLADELRRVSRVLREGGLPSGWPPGRGRAAGRAASS
jgi:hypothetical protein